MEPLWTNKFWGNGNRESPFCGGQEDVTDQVAFKSLLSSVTCSHCLIPLSNLSSPISTPHMKESQATNGRLAESQQHADRWVNSSSIMGFLLLQHAFTCPGASPLNLLLKSNAQPGPEQTGSAWEGALHRCLLQKPGKRSTLVSPLCQAPHYQEARSSSCGKCHPTVAEQTPGTLASQQDAVHSTSLTAGLG